MRLFLEEDIELWLMDIKQGLELYLKNNINRALLDKIIERVN